MYKIKFGLIKGINIAVSWCKAYVFVTLAVDQKFSLLGDIPFLQISLPLIIDDFKIQSIQK